MRLITTVGLCYTSSHESLCILLQGI